MHRVRGVVHGPAAGLRAPQKDVRFVREALLVSAATLQLFPLFTAARRAHRPSAVSASESQHRPPSEASWGRRSGRGRGGGKGKGHRLGYEASPREALSITSAYPASRDVSPSFTSSPLQECSSASAIWRRISATSVRRAGSDLLRG